MAVPIFVNSTQQPAVESVITAAVVNAFVTSGRLKVVSVKEADSILEGDIIGYSLDSIAFNPQINVTEYRLRVRVNILFRDIRQNTTLYKQDGLEQWADFRVQGQVSETLAARGRGGPAGRRRDRPAHRGIIRRPVLGACRRTCCTHALLRAPASPAQSTPGGGSEGGRSPPPSS